MNGEVLLAVLGIVGTLGGALLGWLLNVYTYKIGRTVIRGTFETKITLPPVQSGRAVTGTAKTEYSIKCCAKNSRQIAVLLEDFYFEVQKTKGSKVVRVPALNAEDSCCSVEPIQVTARTTMEPQIIEPRKLNFFTVQIDTNDLEIQYAKLTLCAYDENRKLHKFLVYNGLKAERPTPGVSGKALTPYSRPNAQA